MSTCSREHREERSGTLFPHRPRRTKLLVGALIQRLRHCKPPPSAFFERRRQVGGPAPRRAPLPRRRVRRGCADPAPPAGPSGAAGSGQPLGTLRSPPRPRGGANRAGERVPRSRTYNSQRGGSGSTEIWPLTNFWPGSIYIVLRWSLIPSYNRQNAFVFYALIQDIVGGGQQECGVA